MNCRENRRPVSGPAWRPVGRFGPSRPKSATPVTGAAAAWPLGVAAGLVWPLNCPLAAPSLCAPMRHPRGAPSSQRVPCPALQRRLPFSPFCLSCDASTPMRKGVAGLRPRCGCRRPCWRKDKNQDATAAVALRRAEARARSGGASVGSKGAAPPESPIIASKRR